MDFEFSEEQKMIREAIRSFARSELAPLVDEAEKEREFCWMCSDFGGKMT